MNHDTTTVPVPNHSTRARRRAFWTLLLTVAAWVAGGGPASALVYHYFGGGGANANWSNPANWVVNGVPPANNTNVAVVIMGSANGKTSVVDVAGLTLRSLTFQCTNHVVDSPVARVINLMALNAATPVLEVIKPSETRWFRVTLGANIELSLSGPCAVEGSYMGFEGGGGWTPIDQVILSGRISGSGALHVDGEETVEVVLQGGAGNTYTGGTFVHDNGRLALNKSAGLAIPGALTVDAAWSALVLLLRGHQIADAAPVTLRNGSLDLNGFDEAIGALTLEDGGVSGLNASYDKLGTLTLNGDVTQAAGSVEGGIFSRLDLGTPASSRIGRRFIVNSGTLTLSGNPISGSAILRKTGAGTLVVAGTNTYTGLTVIEDGNLRVEQSQALGATSAGTYVGPLSQVSFAGGLTVAEPFELAGQTNHFLGITPIRAEEGDVTLSGPILLQNPAIFYCNPAPGLGMALTVRGPLSGPGLFWPITSGNGPIVMAGVATNSHTGGTRVEGRLVLSRMGAAPSIPGVLDLRAGRVQTTTSGQLAAGTVVTVGPLAELDLRGTENFAALHGGGRVYLSGGSLTLGEGGADSTYHGVFDVLPLVPDITGVNLYKAGAGTLTFNGTNGFRGQTYVLGGRLTVNGRQTNSPVVLGYGTTLSGTGAVQRITGSGGEVSPGVGPGLMQCGGLALSAGQTIRSELAGTNAGVHCDLLRVTGGVNLGGATLNALVSVGGKPGTKYLLIDNDGSDAVTNTFAGLPQGALVTLSGIQFQISYTGGTGNDVVLTQVSQAPAPTVSGVQKLPGGTMRIQGAGVPGLTYEVQATTTLENPSWVSLGTIVAAPQTGLVQFIDADSALIPTRFYRFLVP